MSTLTLGYWWIVYRVRPSNRSTPVDGVFASDKADAQRKAEDRNGFKPNERLEVVRTIASVYSDRAVALCAVRTRQITDLNRYVRKLG